MNFCPICGKDTNKTFCKEHEQISFSHKDIILRVCKCQRYFYRNRWLPFKTLEEVSTKIAKECIKEKVQVKPIINREIEKKDFDIEVNYQGEIFTISGKVQVEQCPICSKKGTPYFVSTIQLRPKDDEMLEFVKNQAEKDEDAFIAKVVELKDGYNVLLSTNKIAMKISRKLNKSYKGELKITRKHFSRDRLKSKDLFRVTVFFKKL